MTKQKAQYQAQQKSNATQCDNNMCMMLWHMYLTSDTAYNNWTYIKMQLTFIPNISVGSWLNTFISA